MIDHFVVMRLCSSVELCMDQRFFLAASSLYALPAPLLHLLEDSISWRWEPLDSRCLSWVHSETGSIDDVSQKLNLSPQELTFLVQSKSCLLQSLKYRTYPYIIFHTVLSMAQHIIHVTNHTIQALHNLCHSPLKDFGVVVLEPRWIVTKQSR